MAEVFQDLLRKPSEAEHHCLEIRKLTLRECLTQGSFSLYILLYILLYIHFLYV